MKPTDLRTLNLTRTPVNTAIVGSLYTPRGLMSPVQSVPGGRPGKIYLPAPYAAQHHLLAQGAQRDSDGIFILPAQKDDFTSYLPFYARLCITPLNVDVIPMTSFGGSLSNLLTTASWRSVKSIAIESTNRKCRICGTLGTGRYIEAHEIWSYHRCVILKRGIQRLEAILPVCTDCHAMFHPGLAQVRGYLNRTLDRLAWANRWTGAEARRVHRHNMQVWQRRSAQEWILDLSALSGKDTLVLSSKPYVSETGDKLTFEDARGRSVSLGLRGMPFQQGSGEIFFHPAPDASLLTPDV